ncbi:unnamed protein product, partial [Cladocopium goreaui]
GQSASVALAVELAKISAATQCKHEKSRNPVSRRTKESTASVSVASAHEELKAILGRLEGKSGQDRICTPDMTRR